MHAREEPPARPRPGEAGEQLLVQLRILGRLRRQLLGRLRGEVARVRVEIEPLPVRRREEPHERGGGAAEHVLADDGEPAPEHLQLAAWQEAVRPPRRLAAQDRDGPLGADRRGGRRHHAPAHRVLRLEAAVHDGVAGHEDGLRGQVVVAHELLDSAAPLAVPVAERRGHLRLDVEGELVPLAAREVVHLVPDPPEEVARAPHLADVALGEERAGEELGEPRDLEADAGEPERRLEVAQPALRLLHVRLEQVERVAEPVAARAHLRELVREELVHLRLGEAVQLLPLELPEERAVAGEEAQVEQRGARRVVLRRELIAGAQVPDGVAHLELQVPERVEQPLARGLDEGVRLAPAVQDEQVHVRERREVPPAVPAERDDRDRRRRVRRRRLRARALPEDAGGSDPSRRSGAARPSARSRPSGARPR